MSHATTSISLYEPMGDGHVVVGRAGVGGQWIVTWLPPEGDPNWPGFIVAEENSDMPSDADANADAIMEWAKQQAWATPRAAE